MSWRLDEVWLDTDVLWFREQPRTPIAGLALTVPAVAGDRLEPALFMPIATGLEASLQRRLATAGGTSAPARHAHGAGGRTHPRVGHDDPYLRVSARADGRTPARCRKTRRA